MAIARKMVESFSGSFERRKLLFLLDCGSSRGKSIETGAGFSAKEVDADGLPIDPEKNISVTFDEGTAHVFTVEEAKLILGEICDLVKNNPQAEDVDIGISMMANLSEAIKAIEGTDLSKVHDIIKHGSPTIVDWRPNVGASSSTRH